ncbi:MAG TPA: aspartyl protease family protein [Povalibacter sp.]|uniref:aspartyl protease family protein n=1 Tax=Povalibacter sp. TaxID=1962978 RepID=UPI002C56CBA8|nr:aspartyl protease family protein [Povalibacter sp.]HMN44124.1 aspartyl protease family protein [Povalibacter sp.]
MRRACLGAMVWLPGFALPAAATDGIAPTPEEVVTSGIEEVLVEAPEPLYAAPTLRDRIGRVWVPVKINGKGPFRLVLDTGATNSAILNPVVEALGLPINSNERSWLQGVTGNAIVPHVMADSMEVGDLLINRAKLVIVPDVFGGAQGVLGTQGLTDKRIFIDFRRDVVEIVYARGKPRPVGVSVSKFELGRGRLAELDLMVGGVRTRAIIDTGAQQTIGNDRLRDALLLRKRESQDASVIGVTLDVSYGQRIRVPPVVIGDVQVRNLYITFGEMPIFAHWKLTRDPAMLIGMDVIGTLETFAIDYPRRELYLRPRR